MNHLLVVVKGKNLTPTFHTLDAFFFSSPASFSKRMLEFWYGTTLLIIADIRSSCVHENFDGNEARMTHSLLSYTFFTSLKMMDRSPKYTAPSLPSR